MSDLFWLPNTPMAKPSPFVLKSPSNLRVNDRRVLSGIIFINRNRLRWGEKGIFARMMVCLADEHSEKRTVMIDATY